jgi:chorismate synthase
MLRFLTAGESHGPTLTGILEGMPAGLPLSAALLDAELLRRQRGFGSGGRMKIERDHARISAGVLAGKTTGAPIALHIANLDHEKWRDRDIAPMTIPRPGHADLTAAVKYGYRELRLSLERASARETAMRVAVGAVCRALLCELGVTIGGYVVAIGTVAVPAAPEIAPNAAEYLTRFAAAEDSNVRCHHPDTAAQMQTLIANIIRSRDTLGGVVECVALGVPPGLGSHTHWDRRLSAKLGQAVMSIHAVKGCEIGDGFAGCTRPGTQAQDQYVLAGETITQPTNHAGGIEGGISTGGPIVVRVAFKPIATTLTPLGSVDLASCTPAPTQYERSDFCQVPRAVPIVEAMVALVLADALLEKLGGDSLAELQQRLHTLRQLRLPDLQMDNTPWQFGYE